MCPSVSYADSPEVDVKIYNDLGKFYIAYSTLFLLTLKLWPTRQTALYTTGQMLPLTAESIRVTFLYGKLPTGPYLMWAHAFLLKTSSKNASPVG